MEMHAPAVVAVVVTSRPDARFEATLITLLEQDYEALSILVLLGAGGEAAAARVARVSPSILVSHLEEDRGFGASVNRALELIEGAAFLLLCHDDVSLAPDAVHLLVEESFRSNAAIVTPKVVSEQDHSVLLHVGQGLDRYASIVERVMPGEIDQGQHDAVRDVFIAPGGVTLVRDDLLRSIGGYDERYLAMGDDAELCWRARMAGARIVCAPQAMVAHAERLAAGSRVLEPLPDGEPAPSLGRLRRRNELRMLVTCWHLPRRILVLASLAVLNLAEIAVAAAGGDHERAVDIREAWRQAWRDRGDNRRARKHAEASRTVSDRTVRSFQSPGATRLRTFLTIFLHQGYDAARGALGTTAQEEEAVEGERSSDLVGFGGAFSDDEGFDELDDLGNRVRRHSGPHRRLSSTRSLLVVALLALALFVAGSRDLIGSRLPMIGQLLPLGSLGSIWHRVFASWQPAGLGSGAPGHPGYTTLGLFGIVTLGQMGVLLRLVLLAAIPVGALGVFRLLRGLASNRARLLAALAFAGLALGTNEIATGSISGLVVFAATPFLLRRLLRLARCTPFDEPFSPSVPFASRGWRRSASGQVAAMGLFLALVASLAPAVLISTALASLCLLLVGLLARGGRPLAGQGRVAGALGIAVLLLAPLFVVAADGGLSGLQVFGISSGPWSSPGLGGLLRFALGPNGGGALAWLLPAAALVPLLIAREQRFALSARMAAIGVGSLGLGLWVSRGGWGSFAPQLDVVLAPLATAISVLVGLGLAALETDLVVSRFGWRQLVGTLGVLAALVGLIPAIGSVGTGRWKMPTAGYGDALGYLATPAASGQRVLWLGDPRSIPGSSWGIEPGLAWSTSSGGLPNASNLLAPPSLAAASAITTALGEALDGRTSRLGQLLAPAGVGAIVVTTAIAPTLPGVQVGQSTPPPAGLITALLQQRDLAEVPGGSGVVVFGSNLAMSAAAVRSTALAPPASASDPSAIAGWRPLSLAHPLSGAVTTSEHGLFVGLAPAGDFSLSGASTPQPAFGWARSATVTARTVTVSLSALPIDALVAAVMLFAWVALVLALLGRHRWLDWWWPKTRSRAPRGRHEAIGEAA
jgi:GT2 family glycosyltransferase